MLGEGMTSIPASLTDLKVQVAMSMTLGMVLDDSNLDSSGLMGTSALLGDEGMFTFLLLLFYFLLFDTFLYSLAALHLFLLPNFSSVNLVYYLIAFILSHLINNLIMVV